VVRVPNRRQPEGHWPTCLMSILVPLQDPRWDYPALSRDLAYGGEWLLSNCHEAAGN